MRSIDDFGFGHPPDTPELAEMAFLEAHRELEERPGPYAFDSLAAARAFILGVCAWLTETDERALGRTFPKVVEPKRAQVKGYYNDGTKELALVELLHFSALHEVAHWLAPAPDVWQQHNRDWRAAQTMLVAECLGPGYGVGLTAAYEAALREAGGTFEGDRPQYLGDQP